MQFLISMREVVCGPAQRIERWLSPALHHVHNALIILWTQGHDVPEGLSPAIENQILRPEKNAVWCAP